MDLDVHSLFVCSLQTFPRRLEISLNCREHNLKQFILRYRNGHIIIITNYYNYFFTLVLHSQVIKLAKGKMYVRDGYDGEYHHY